MESNIYNFLLNQNPKDINEENRDSEAPPSIIQSQIDINSQSSELINGNKESDSNLDMDIKLNSKENGKEDNNSISLEQNENLEENEADAPQIASIISQQEINIGLNNINQDIGENNNLDNFPCPEPKKGDNLLLDNERPKDSDLKDRTSDDYYKLKSFGNKYYYSHHRFKFPYNPYFSYFPFGTQYSSYESYFSFGFNYPYRHHFPFGRFNRGYI